MKFPFTSARRATFIYGPLAAATFGLLTTGFVSAETMPIDPSQSQVSWVGKKVTGQHDGIVPIEGGTVEFNEDGDLIGGTFTISISELVNKDLESPKWKTKLETHLKSDDFFNVIKFPNATFTITKVRDKRTDGSGPVDITGNLTVKGISHAVTFPATVEKTDNGYKATGKLAIDRTKWDIRYNSGRFFDPANLGDKLIYDSVDIGVKVTAVKQLS